MKAEKPWSIFYKVFKKKLVLVNLEVADIEIVSGEDNYNF